MKKHIKPYLFAFKVVWQSSAKWTSARFVLILLQSLLPLVSLYLMKLIIDTVLAEGDLSMDTFDHVLSYLIYFGIVILVQAISTILSQLVSEAQEQRVGDYMAEVVQKKALSLDLSYFENPQFHNTYFQAQREALFRPVRIITSLMNVIQNGISLILIAGFLSFMHYSVAIVLIVSIIPTVFIRYHFSKKLYTWQKKRISVDRESVYLNTVIGGYPYAKEVRVFNAGQKLKQKFKTIRDKLFNEKLKIGIVRTRSSIIAKVIEIAAEVGVYIFIVYRTVQGTITVGDMVIYFQAFQKGKTNLTNALNSLVQLMENRMFLTYISDFLQFKSKLNTLSPGQELPVVINNGIEFQNVSFAYPDQPDTVLKEISVTFKKGEICALVGENGSGKTTLIKLLCRLYDPTKGQVLLDGESIQSYEPDEYQSKLSVTFQDFVQYQFNVKDNITLSDDYQENFDKITKVAKASGADTFINELPEKYEQQLGREFAKGTELSLGQWQKIAISRAIYREAEIIIMDEPTSAIDPLAESKIFEELKNLAKDRIIILVTHRLYNLKMADKIIVMDHGRILKDGNHEKLINRKGHYFKMFEKQVH